MLEPRRLQFRMPPSYQPPRTANRKELMSLLTQTSERSVGLCRSIVLRSGHRLIRDRTQEHLWQCEHDAPQRLRDVVGLLSNTARVQAHYGFGSNPERTRAAVLCDIRLVHGQNFLWGLRDAGRGQIAYDEVDDPDLNRYRFSIEGGAHLPYALAGADPDRQKWMSPGPTTQEKARCCLAAVFAVHTLNRSLGSQTDLFKNRGDYLDLVPPRPWRILETDDQLFIMDAHDDEIMSLRTANAIPLQPVGRDALGYAARIVKQANDFNTLNP